MTAASAAPQGKVSQQRGLETRAAFERIAAFVLAARPKHLMPNFRQLFKRNFLDSAGFTSAALPSELFHALREQFEEYRAPGRWTLIGGGETSADHAVLISLGLMRYVDLLNSYIPADGLCHPSDNLGAVVAAAEQVVACGEEIIFALAVTYEIQFRFTAAVSVTAKGFNHATRLAISAAASAGELFRLCAGEIANAIAIATRWTTSRLPA